MSLTCCGEMLAHSELRVIVCLWFTPRLRRCGEGHQGKLNSSSIHLSAKCICGRRGGVGQPALLSALQARHFHSSSALGPETFRRLGATKEPALAKVTHLKVNLKPCGKCQNWQQWWSGGKQNHCINTVDDLHTLSLTAFFLSYWVSALLRKAETDKEKNVFGKRRWKPLRESNCEGRACRGRRKKTLALCHCAVKAGWAVQDRTCTLLCITHYFLLEKDICLGNERPL